MGGGGLSKYTIDYRLAPLIKGNPGSATSSGADFITKN